MQRELVECNCLIGGRDDIRVRADHSYGNQNSNHSHQFLRDGVSVDAVTAAVAAMVAVDPSFLPSAAIALVVFSSSSRTDAVLSIPQVALVRKVMMTMRLYFSVVRSSPERTSSMFYLRYFPTTTTMVIFCCPFLLFATGDNILESRSKPIVGRGAVGAISKTRTWEVIDAEVMTTMAMTMPRTIGGSTTRDSAPAPC